MRLDFHDCLQALGADLAVCDAEWDRRVGAHHWLGKTDDEAMTLAFGELYDTYCVSRCSSPIMTISIHQASLAASTTAQAA